MTNLHSTRLWLASALGALLLTSACSEDGQSFGSGKCPELPLYSWVDTDPAPDNSVWQRVDIETRQPLTTAELGAIQTAESNGCLTPAGFATDLNAGGARGSGGGASDAGGD